MKQLRICYTKFVMLDVEDDITKDDINEMVDMIAADEVLLTVNMTMLNGR